MRPDGRGIAVRRERSQQGLIERRPGPEEPVGAAMHNDPGIEPLAALDPRNDPDDRVLEGLSRNRTGAGTAARTAAATAIGAAQRHAWRLRLLAHCPPPPRTAAVPR